MIKKYFTFFSLLICFVACKEKVCPVAVFDEEIKAWIVYQRGSYWIYENDSTQSRDSIYCTYTRFGTSPGTDCGQRDEVIGRETLRSHFWDDVGNNWNLYSEATENEADFITRFTLGVGNGITIPFNFYFPFPKQGNTNPFGTIDTLYQNWTLNGVTYPLVAEVNVGGNWEKTIWVARNNFILKTYIPNTGESWSLINSHIIQ